MEVLRSRFKRTAEDQKSPGNRDRRNVFCNLCISILLTVFSVKNDVSNADDDTYYPGVNSLKKIKVSPPKAGQMYPDLNDIYGTDSDR